MDSMNFASSTATKPKKIGTPVTVLEKYEKLRLKNNNIDKLVEAFDLEINL